MKRLSLVLLALLAVTLRTEAQSPPDALHLEPPWKSWTAADLALSDSGHHRTEPRLRKNLERQRAAFAGRFISGKVSGLADGTVPPEDYCSTASRLEAATSDRAWVETTDFLPALLLSDVAIEATIAAVTPGFRQDGAPVLLLTLSDVLPLHRRSALPAHVLLPVGRLVIEGHVYCGSAESVVGLPPVSGDRVVVVGAWRTGAVVNVGDMETGSFAVVTGDSLVWSWGRGYGPSTADDLRALVDRAVAERLFDSAERLVHQPWGSADRRQFARDYELLVRGQRPTP